MSFKYIGHFSLERRTCSSWKTAWSLRPSSGSLVVGYGVETQGIMHAVGYRVESKDERAVPELVLEPTCGVITRSCSLRSRWRRRRLACSDPLQEVKFSNYKASLLMSSLPLCKILPPFERQVLAFGSVGQLRRLRFKHGHAHVVSGSLARERVHSGAPANTLTESL